MQKKIWLLGFLFMLMSGAVTAHDFWIEPSRVDYDPDQTLTLTLREGAHYKGNSVPYIDGWLRAFTQFDGRRERQIKSDIGDDPAARMSGALTCGRRSGFGWRRQP